MVLWHYRCCSDSTGGEIGWSEWSQLKSEGLGLKGAGKRSTGAV